MRLARIVVMVLMVSVFLFPLVIRAQTAPSPPTLPVIPEAEVRQFIGQYIERFQGMNLDGLMALFSKDAVENRKWGYSDMREAYRKTFDATKEFAYNLKIQTVQTYTRSALVTGRYEIIQTLKEVKEGSITKIYRGNIQWDLIRDDGGLKVLRVNYGMNL